MVSSGDYVSFLCIGVGRDVGSKSGLLGTMNCVDDRVASTVGDTVRTK